MLPERYWILMPGFGASEPPVPEPPDGRWVPRPDDQVFRYLHGMEDMLPYQVVAVAIRVFALGFGIRRACVDSRASDYSDREDINYWVLYNLVKIAIALGLVFGAGKVAR